MPCQDINETIILNLDSDYKVLDYHLNKKTCLAQVGSDSLILDWIAGKSPEQILNVTLEELFDYYQAAEDVQKFIILKHYCALASLLAILAGWESGALGQSCVIQSLDQTEKGIQAVAQINLKLDAGKVQPCIRCCSSHSGANKAINVILGSKD